MQHDHDAVWNTLTDEALILRVQQGETDAFGTVYARHRKRIAHYLHLAGVPAAEVDDLLGETFCRALDKVRQFDCARGRPYLGYLYAVARNLATDRIRYRPRVESLETLAGWEPVEETHEERIVSEIVQLEQVRLIRRAMERLPPRDREILGLAYDRSLSSREIMEILGKPSVTSVTTHIYKAMQKLREHVRALERAAGVERRR